jgi:quercetin dioxygenase-like cupin family protein
MLSRRSFTRVVGCVLCGITSGFAATEAFAQYPSSATTSGGVTRKILSKMDGPADGYETVNVEAIIDAGVPVVRHTHPGIESAYIMEGGFELPIQGHETRMLKAGDSVQIPPETPHGGGKAGTEKTRVLITYVVQKGKPLASPA